MKTILSILALSILFFSPICAQAEEKRNLAVQKNEIPPNEQRVALIIGNSSYSDAPLANPVNDARAITEALSKLGFKVTKKENVSKKEMHLAIRAFGSELKKGGVGLFYYAGHGMQVNGLNYLIPVGEDIKSDDEVEFSAIDANVILSKMEDAQNRVNIVILDACRNNPFIKRSRRGAARGLAKMSPTTGSIIEFAAGEGQEASDGDGKNGLFTQHFLASLQQRDTSIESVFKRVRAAVSEATNRNQVPAEYSSLIGNFYFNQQGQPLTGIETDSKAMEIVFWESIKESKDPKDFESYLEKYPDGQFSPLARNALSKSREDSKLHEEEVKKVEAEKGRLASEKLRLHVQEQRMQEEAKARENELHGREQRIQEEVNAREKEFAERKKEKDKTIFVPPTF